MLVLGRAYPADNVRVDGREVGHALFRYERVNDGDVVPRLTEVKLYFVAQRVERAGLYFEYVVPTEHVGDKAARPRAALR